MSSDYRCSDYCTPYSKIPLKKESLESKIKASTKRRNMYKAISEQNSLYNRQFRIIYNCKCSFCGVSLDIQDYHLFEIDHFICISHPESEEDPNRMSNLVFACEMCNRKKSDFAVLLSNEASSGKPYTVLLNPDYGDITSVFVRDSNYNIKIAPSFTSDRHINDFYNKLLLHNPVRRLDYLLLSLKGLKSTCNDEKIKGILANAINLLLETRNHGNYQ